MQHHVDWFSVLSVDIERDPSGAFDLAVDSADCSQLVIKLKGCKVRGYCGEVATRSAVNYPCESTVVSIRGGCDCCMVLMCMQWVAKASHDPDRGSSG